MSRPKVSFIVPCYKLAGLLPICIASILRQTWTDFEILVMDDCSPDHTGDVVRSFPDARIRYVRNDPNLGHLANYNKGISLSHGAYVWLISADDYLRSPDVLSKYVALMDAHPRVGYVFCPGYGVRDGVETTLLGRLREHRDRDRVLSGEALLKKLLWGNFVLTPSGMVRRQCYEQLGAFPLDLPWCGDWYLWCLFALHHDVGYFAQPMVCYREQHALSMTDKLTRESLDACGAEEIRVSWRIHEHAQRLGRQRVLTHTLAGLAHTYARTIAGARYRDASTYMNFEWMEASLKQHAGDEAQRARIRTRVHAEVGNECYWRRDLVSARRHYLKALAMEPWALSVASKALLASFGRPGEYLRRTIVSLL